MRKGKAIPSMRTLRPISRPGLLAAGDSQRHPLNRTSGRIRFTMELLEEGFQNCRATAPKRPGCQHSSGVCLVSGVHLAVEQSFLQLLLGMLNSAIPPQTGTKGVKGFDSLTNV